MSSNKQTGLHMNQVDELLRDYYYGIKQSNSFQGVQKLYHAIKNDIPDIKLKIITDWLKKQETYSVHLPIKTNFKRNPIVSTHIDHNWHSDLIEISYPNFNDNFRYILMVIDNLSKFGWAIPIKDKSASTVKKAFLSILRQSKRKPLILSTDAGKEFTNSSLKKYLK